MTEDVSNDIAVYCVFCVTGFERDVIVNLEKIGCKCLAPYANRLIVRRNKTMRQQRRLLPGYVFFQLTDAQPDWLKISLIPYVFRVLDYGDGEYRLKGSDMAFYRMLLRYDGIMDVSKVCRVGTKIRVVDGPLREFEGCITAVNMRQRSVAISLGGDSVFQKIWCSVDLIEPAENCINLDA